MYVLPVFTNDVVLLLDIAHQTGAVLGLLAQVDYNAYQLSFDDYEHYMQAKRLVSLYVGGGAVV